MTRPERPRTATRDALEWLYPGVGIKRWGVMIALGAIGLAGGVYLIVGALAAPALLALVDLERLVGRSWATSVLAFDLFLVGALFVAVGSHRAWVFHRTTPETAKEIRSSTRLARGPRIVAMGGGHGLAALLSGLKVKTSNLTAVVTMADDGGSSGRLRRDMGMPPPGDLRNCLVALADDESLMSKLFRYRFPEEGGLQGHSFGNLFMAALTEVTGDFERAVYESTRVLKIRGRVLPATLDDIVLNAELYGGREVSGESSITASSALPRRVWITPQAPRALPQALAALARADLVVLGPGSLYTSVLPNLLIPKVHEAVAETKATVVYVCNVMTEPGETDGYSAADHVEALWRHGLRGLVDTVLVNEAPIDAALVASYSRQGAAPVHVDEERLRALRVRVVKAPLIADGDFVRHDPQLLAQALERLA